MGDTKKEYSNMDAITAIMTRRSVRKFDTAKPINDEQLELVLKAGMHAPSSHNRRAWEFIVTRNADTLQAIADASTYAKMTPSAGCAIVVCSNTAEMEQYYDQDCAAAIQNMLLAIHALGLGAVWCAVRHGNEMYEEIKRVMKLPETIEPMGMVVVGTPAQQPREAERYEPEKVHYEQW